MHVCIASAGAHRELALERRDVDDVTPAHVGLCRSQHTPQPAAKHKPVDEFTPPCRILGSPLRQLHRDPARPCHIYTVPHGAGNSSEDADGKRRWCQCHALRMAHGATVFADSVCSSSDVDTCR